jgi:hypothetical protein
MTAYLNDYQISSQCLISELRYEKEGRRQADYAPVRDAQLSTRSSGWGLN